MNISKLPPESTQRIELAISRAELSFLDDPDEEQAFHRSLHGPNNSDERREVLALQYLSNVFFSIADEFANSDLSISEIRRELALIKTELVAGVWESKWPKVDEAIDLKNFNSGMAHSFERSPAMKELQKFLLQVAEWEASEEGLESNANAFESENKGSQISGDHYQTKEARKNALDAFRNAWGLFKWEAVAEKLGVHVADMHAWRRVRAKQRTRIEESITRRP